MKKNNNLKNILYIIVIALIVSCTLSPEIENKPELKAVQTEIKAPENVIVTNNHSTTAPSITLTWDSVDGATYYVVEYQTATDYLASNEIKSIIVGNVNTFKLESSNLTTNANDMRYVFNIRAGIGTSTKILSSNSLKDNTNPSYFVEGAIVNSFAVSPVISNNTLTFSTTFPKYKSVLNASENIVNVIPEVRYYENEIEITDDEIRLGSAEQKTITAKLYVNNEEITSQALTVKNSVNYIPNAVELNVSSNQIGKISLSWTDVGINQGLNSSDISTTLKYEIRRKKSTESDDKYAALLNSDDTTLYIESTGDDITYEDTSIETNVEYDYKVISWYDIIIGDTTKVSYSNNDSSASIYKGAHALYTAPKTFTVEKISGFDEVTTSGEATYKVKLDWTFYNKLDDTTSIRITRWDFDALTIVDGNPTDTESQSDKYTLVYDKTTGGYSNTTTTFIDTFTLSEEENKTQKQYVYYMQFISDDVPVNVSTIAKAYDNPNEDGIIKTLPSVEQVEFINSLSISKDGNAYSDKIVLTWTLNTEKIEALNLDSNNVSVEILRKEEHDSTSFHSAIAKNINGTALSYSDIDIEKGVTYSYIVQATYNDSSSSYNGQKSQTDQSTGNSLRKVDNLTATINTYNDRIVLSWDPVDNASGYDIYYRDNQSSYRKYGDTLTATEAEIYNLTAGTEYYLIVLPKDSHDNTTAPTEDEETPVRGSILGPITPTVTGGDSAKSDYIDISWKAVENVTSYYINVYSDSNGTNKVIDTIIVNSGSDLTSIQFTPSQIPDTKREELGFYLSQKYYFSVTPYVKETNIKSTTSPLIDGNWVMPPTTITATKASYRDLIIVTWNPVDNADGYVVYRKVHNSNDNWAAVKKCDSTELEYKDYITNGTGFYDYSIASVLNPNETIVGAIQDIFTSAYDEYDNYGYILEKPQDVNGEEYKDTMYALSWNRVLGATSYTITLNEIDSFTINVSDISDYSSTMNPSDKDAFYNKSGERITVYIGKDNYNSFITYSVFPTIGVSATNSNAVIADKKTTSLSSITTAISKLTRKQIANIVAYNLNTIFRLVDGYATVDDADRSDWWAGGFPSVGSEEKVIISSKLLNANRRYAYDSDYGNLKLGDDKGNGYEINGNYISGEVQCYPKDEGAAGYLGNDPLNYISGTYSFQLPGDFPNIEVTFSKYYVSNDKTGTTISISYNNDDWQLATLSVGLLESV